MADWQKLIITLLLDKVYIREEVVYKKHTGQNLSLSNVGDINNHLPTIQVSATIDCRGGGEMDRKGGHVSNIYLTTRDSHFPSAGLGHKVKIKKLS